MKRNLIIEALAVFVFSSIFLLSSCAKKQVVTEEKKVKAPTKVEKVKKEGPTAEELQKAREAEEAKLAEKARLEKLKEKEMAEKRAWQERRVANIEAKSIYFDFDKSLIRAEYRSVLEEKAAFLKDNPDISIRIEGNCDERGTNEYNLALGERRANSAAKFLISLGISPDRIETISYGEERPLALGHSEEAWAQNRRDDFVVAE